MTSGSIDPRVTEALTGAASLHATVRECRLTTIGPSGDGDVYKFAAERVVIGADAGSTITIADSTMSKFHCEIFIRDGLSLVRDLGSRNGTWINRVAVIEAPLVDGSLIVVGRTELRFSIGARQVKLRLSAADHFGLLRGGSVPMRAVYAELEVAAKCLSTLLIMGESGTGKGLAAESVHLQSARTDEPFVVLDCGAIPENLIEAELFGFEAGAFTGADRARRGAFEAANGGTLFLDEIGELPLNLQPKLLRALDQREIQRVGSTERRKLDVRIIAATNRELRTEVNARRFRSDLYFRLAVLTVRMPPLREHTVDIPVLVEAILTGLGDTESPMARSLISGALLPDLLRHAWPGNARELRNHVEACIARQESILDHNDRGQPTIDTSQPIGAARDRWVRYFERRYLEQLLADHDGNVSAAARTAGVARVHLHRLLRRAGLRGEA